jgi:hypothetical protein
MMVGLFLQSEIFHCAVEVRFATVSYALFERA